jgi:hypothetical protein
MTPSEYNDAIVIEQNKIIALVLEMYNSSDDIDLAEASRLKIIEQCKKSIDIVGAMEPYDGNTDLRDAAINLFKFYKDIASVEFKRLIELLNKEELTDVDYEEIDVIDMNVSSRETPLDEAFAKAQRDFSNKYNLTLEKNEYQDAIDGK